MILLHNAKDCEQVLLNTSRYLVPTMGALHSGHCSLIREAKSLANDHGCVIVSIFVNPTQFDRKEDLESYPNTLEHDLKLCEENGADYVFIPKADEMYIHNRSISLVETTLSQQLCGRTRPGHFDGVCLVVNKLFNICQATHALFGEKDFQQLAIIKRMTRDLNMRVEVIGVKTVREPSGLAMSSRNLLLTEENKQYAPSVYKALTLALETSKAGENDAATLIDIVTSEFKSLPVETTIDYLEVVDADTIQPLNKIKDTHAMMAIAIYFGDVRLIDHIHLS